MYGKSSVDCCKILKFWRQGSEIWWVKHGPPHDNFGYFDFSGILTSKTTNFRRIDFCNFSHIQCTQKVLPMPRNSGDSAEWIWRNLGPNMAKSEIFKSPYLPQMGADSPHSKTVFIRVPRAIMLMHQIGGRAPPRGQTWKVGVGPKFWSPISQKIDGRFSPNFLCGKGVWIPIDVQILGKIVSLEKSQDESFINLVGGLWPLNYTEYPDLAWHVYRGRRPSSYGSHYLVPGPVVSEKLGVE